MPNTESYRDKILKALRQMPYGEWRLIEGDLAEELFPPPPRPTMNDLIVDIAGALSSDRGEWKSNLPPDDAPRNTLEVIRKELGDDFIVDRRRDANLIEVVRPVAKCPHCKGRGFVRKPIFSRLGHGIPGILGGIQSEDVECGHQPIME